MSRGRSSWSAALANRVSRLSARLHDPAIRAAAPSITADHGSANATIFDPTDTPTYCFPSTAYVIGDECHDSFV